MPTNSMAPLDYVDVPVCATYLWDQSPSPDTASVRPTPKVTTSLPRPEHAQTPSILSPTAPSSQSLSPSKLVYSSIPQLLLASTLQLPANASVPETPRKAGKGAVKLVSTRDPLSIPITTVNFKRFVSKIGPVFWLQDRIEEVVMWRKGNRYTSVWMGVYAFICCFPRLVLLLPHVIVLSILLATHPSLRSNDDSDADTKAVPTPPPAQAGEGSVDWLANVQAIQNLMGVFSDFHDALLPVVPHLTHSSPYTPIILTLALLSFLVLLPILPLLPLRPAFLGLGLFPLFLTHPFTRLTLLPALLAGARPLIGTLRTRARKLIDDDRLEDRHWKAKMREVELFENERWAAEKGKPGSVVSTSNMGGEDAAKSDVGWSKANLKPGDRKAWTRGRDGWSGVGEDGSWDVSSNLTFALEPGWAFVETEDWRPDLEGTWLSPGGADDCGWAYTNDAWLEPRRAPSDEWQATGITRRRRWTRRIYYDPEATDSV